MKNDRDRAEYLRPCAKEYNSESKGDLGNTQHLSAPAGGIGQNLYAYSRPTSPKGPRARRKLNRFYHGNHLAQVG